MRFTPTIDVVQIGENCCKMIESRLFEKIGDLGFDFIRTYALVTNKSGFEIATLREATPCLPDLAMTQIVCPCVSPVYL
jgi:hypothetical protein